MREHLSELCYTDTMPEQKCWLNWARILQHWGMKETAAAFLEAAGPMNILFAQMIHFGEPFLRWAWPGGEWRHMAETLENQEDCRIFAAYLRDEELQ
jgi:hypothetical protein